MFINFNLYPKELHLNKSITEKTIAVLKLYLVTIGLSIICFIPAFIINAIVLSKYHFSIIKENDSFLNKMTPQFRYLLVPLIGPIIEETLFRLWQNYKMRNIAISLTVLVFELFHFFSFADRSSNDKLILYIIHIGICAISCLIIAIAFRNFGSVNLSESYKKILFYCSVFAFGLIHIGNYTPLHYQLLYVYPFFIIPQIIMGFTIGYTRLSYGFIWGLILHIIINIPATIFYTYH